MPQYPLERNRASEKTRHLLRSSPRTGAQKEPAAGWHPELPVLHKDQAASPWAPEPASLLQGCSAQGCVSCSYYGGDAKIPVGEFMEGMTSGQRHPSSIFKMQNRVYLASEGMFAHNIAAERRKHWNTFFQQANPRLLTASGKLKHP